MSVEARLRKDLKKAIRVARFWKERYASLTWCTDSSHRYTPPPTRFYIPSETRRPGHMPRRHK